MMKTLQYIWVIVSRVPDFPNYGTSMDSIVHLVTKHNKNELTFEFKSNY